jgi:hypothetical protein
MNREAFRPFSRWAQTRLGIEKVKKIIPANALHFEAQRFSSENFYCLAVAGNYRRSGSGMFDPLGRFRMLLEVVQ